MRFLTAIISALAALLLVVAGGSVAASPAFAQEISPTGDQYDDQVSQIDERTNAPSADSDGLGARAGALPFTGYDLIAIAAIAVATIGLGLGLQRAGSGKRGDEPG